MRLSRWLDEDEAIALRVIGLLVGVLLVAVIGFAVLRSGPQPAPAPALEVDVSGLRIEASLDGVVKLYFAPGKHEVGRVADAALATLVQDLVDGRSLVISGFHDATGDSQANMAQAERRAAAVQAALLRLGARPERVQVQKPLELTGAAGDSADAQRVEVVLQ